MQYGNIRVVSLPQGPNDLTSQMAERCVWLDAEKMEMIV